MELTEQDWQIISKLLDQALDMPAERRQSWLDTLGSQDAAFREKLRELLADHAAAEIADFLKTLPNLTVSRPSEATTPPTDKGASVVGPYRIIRELGRGGMGTVWLAERTDGLLKRPVALKLPHSGIADAKLAERFARERDILAGLTHPNIARLYDAGIASSGQAYLALEYVDGAPLTTYCDAHALPVRQRIELFVQVLEAVQYAHAHLVVHRDLKPSNILVTEDGRGHLLDFGIAKLLTDGTARETELTQVGGRALTPDYASPEQIAGQPISTASDVYALGVVLYELLAGARPYRLKHDMRGELEEAILRVDPVRPSQALKDGVAPARSVPPKKLAHILKGDLDTIVLKALKKQPVERYGTVEAFAQDLARYLAGKPVLARPDSVWYRTQKFLIRHRLLVAAAAAIILALAVVVVTATIAVTLTLAIGLAGSLWQASRARNHARIAEAQAHRARTEARTAQAVQDFLQDIFRANSIDQPDPSKSRQTTAAELLAIGAKKIDGALDVAPDTKLKVLETLAQMFEDLELTKEAAALDRKRVQLARALYGENDPAVARALVRLAVMLRPSPEVEERSRALDEAIRILDHNGDFSSKTRARLVLELAYGYSDKDLTKALELTEQATRINAAYPPDRDAVSALIQEGVTHSLRHELTESESSYYGALAALDAIRPATNHDRSQIYTYLGQTQRELQKFPAAEASHRLAFKVAQAVGGPDHLLSLIAQLDLGWFLFETGRHAEGLEVLTRAKDRLLETRATDPQTIPWALNRYGRALLQMGRLEEACSVLDQAAQRLREHRPGSGYLATVLDFQASALIALGWYAEAKALLDNSAEIHAKINDAAVYVNENLAARASLLVAIGSGDAASALLDGFSIADATPGTLSVTWMQSSLARADVHLACGRFDDARALARAVRVDVECSPSRSYFKGYEAQSALCEGKALMLMHHTADAVHLLERALELGESLYDRDRSCILADARVALANAYADLGERDHANELLAQAEMIHATHKELGEHIKGPLRQLADRLRMHT